MQSWGVKGKVTSEGSQRSSVSVSGEVRREAGERDPGAQGPGGTVTETGRGAGWGATRS